jgi:hypothetical protein
MLPFDRSEPAMSASSSITSGRTAVRFLAASLLSVAALGSAVGASPAAKPAISEEASAALSQMGQTLLGKQFSFQARTLRVYADVDGRFLHIGHTMKVLVRRPDRMRVDIEGDDGATQVFYDGKTLVLYGPAKKEYISIPVPDTIEGMIKEAETRVGFDFPIADLVSSTPDKSVLSGVTEAKIVNEVTIDGAPSNHLTLFQPPGLELELWLAKTAQALPERIFITYRSLPGQPNFIAQFSDWNLAVMPTDADFTFQPPEGAKQVELKSASSDAPAPGKAKGATQ